MLPCPLCSEVFMHIHHLEQHVDDHFCNDSSFGSSRSSKVEDPIVVISTSSDDDEHIIDVDNKAVVIESDGASGRNLCHPSITHQEALPVSTRLPTHFITSTFQHPSPDPVPAGLDPSPDPVPAGLDGPHYDTHSVMCPLGCKQWIALKDMDSHELMHRLSEEESSAADVALPPGPYQGLAPLPGHAAECRVQDQEIIDLKLLTELQEQEDFEALQIKYGFSDKRPGNCFTCGKPCHWSSDCPHNPRSVFHQQQRVAAGYPGNGGSSSIYGSSVNRSSYQLRSGLSHAELSHLQRREPQWTLLPVAVDSRLSNPQPLLPTGSAVIVNRPEVPVTDSPLGLIGSIAGVLRNQPGASSSNYTAYLSGPVQHLSGQYNDRGWGCGWRNIQMISSHLLVHCRRSSGRPHEDGRGGRGSLPQEEISSNDKLTIQRALFGGAGFVPDIASLQAWLEVAWADGFDPPGFESLGGKVLGSRKWIGTTEAATLLRYFGVKAHIVDFLGPKRAIGSAGTVAHNSSLVVTSGNTGHQAVASAADRPAACCHLGVTCDLCNCCPIIGLRYKSLSRENFDLCEVCYKTSQGREAGPFNILDFSDTAVEVHEASHQVAGPVAPQSQITAQTGSAATTLAEDQQQTQHQHQHRHQHQQAHRSLLKWVWNYFSGQHAATRHMFKLADYHCSPALGPPHHSTITSSSVVMQEPSGAPSVAAREEALRRPLASTSSSSLPHTFTNASLTHNDRPPVPRCPASAPASEVFAVQHGGTLLSDRPDAGIRSSSSSLLGGPAASSHKLQQSLSTAVPIRSRFESFSNNKENISSQSVQQPATRVAGAAAEYGGRLVNSKDKVTCTGMPPLYFQHEGHSRTIVGIERRREKQPDIRASVRNSNSRSKRAQTAAWFCNGQLGASDGKTTIVEWVASGNKSLLGSCKDGSVEEVMEPASVQEVKECRLDGRGSSSGGLAGLRATRGKKRSPTATGNGYIKPMYNKQAGSMNTNADDLLMPCSGDYDMVSRKQALGGSGQQPQRGSSSGGVDVIGSSSAEAAVGEESRHIVRLHKELGDDGYVYTLLVLDPGISADALREALSAGKGWQCMLKRGLHTLTKPEYQVMYVLDTLVDNEAERGALKVMKAVEVVRPQQEI
ncbi:hypothetical protein CEUSTIGMA_g9729.t1 [Chlamydomonas eustigma]|uniref:Uncharacterized protein n=1 Tax=Chlamydomonas eustigma TaxID=1157962 RepID=A0A250XHM3_9CHLO|nr:hypothetical protein CEUSTIGMA_g9729.t1 [Chlamydomonas eustigma]|eukprot:GAX82300.1 hypothetical protein CEUSTIGMA_g9729.t1 [Chlamydomonas eustigma]